MSKKILIIGDSSALPRQEVPYYQTYPTLLKLKLPIMQFENTSQAGLTSTKVSNSLDAFTLYGYDADIVILNIGIVDVFPRPYPPIIEQLLIASRFQKLIDPFLKKTRLYYKLGDICGFSQVSPIEFKQNILSITNRLLKKNVEKIIIIGIIKPSKVLLNSKTVTKKIQLYNQHLKTIEKISEKVYFLDIYSHTSKEFSIWDGYHYSVLANQFIANHLYETIMPQ